MRTRNKETAALKFRFGKTSRVQARSTFWQEIHKRLWCMQFSWNLQLKILCFSTDIYSQDKETTAHRGTQQPSAGLTCGNICGNILTAFPHMLAKNVSKALSHLKGYCLRHQWLSYVPGLTCKLSVIHCWKYAKIARAARDKCIWAYIFSYITLTGSLI